MDNYTLVVNGLVTEFITDKGAFPAVSNLSLEVKRGEILCIVGESGSGKTVASLSIMQLLPNSGRVTSGEIWFEGQNLLELPLKEISKIRGNAISMIFQDPMSSLDPLFTCGEQIVETIQTHQGISKKEALNKAKKLLKQVGIAHPDTIAHAYPHELSGGMCQRVMIAMALSCEPKLLIADEPTTALDVTVQSQILKLLKLIRNEMNMSIIFITHDLGVVAEVADRVAVMYAGQVVEEGDVKTIFKNPIHPYTKGLLKSIPDLNNNDKKLYSIEGSVPGISEMPIGCRFQPRCPVAFEKCLKNVPSLLSIDTEHKVRCWKRGGKCG